MNGKKKPATHSAADPLLIEALARYRLLTIDQAHLVGCGSKELVGERLRVMARHKLVEFLNQPRFLGPRVHWLREKGAALATDLAAERGQTLHIVAPRNGFTLGAHLNQRLGIVDCHIALRMWAKATGGAVEWFRVEFEANPSGMLAKALSYPWARPDGALVQYQPDGAGVVRLADGERFLFALEMETGRDNFTAKLPDRLAAMEAAALEGGTLWPEGERRARLLFVVPDDAMLKVARSFAAKQDSAALPFVFFNTLPNMRSSFADGWVKASGEKGTPFRSQ
jgi:hypothetical protein